MSPTPEERAAAIIARYSNTWEDWTAEEAFVAAEIRAAVDAETEACARVIDDYGGPRDTDLAALLRQRAAARAAGEARPSQETGETP